jgi:hypothetical protein
LLIKGQHSGLQSRSLRVASRRLRLWGAAIQPLDRGYDEKNLVGT